MENKCDYLMRNLSDMRMKVEELNKKIAENNIKYSK
jgi:hypothetical protein